ncbi:hypothetical protein [Bradyrhizobium sp. SZCCHNR2011]|uniref:hypothetical protein n=1 Tax=Bradyrhizobium sp. SZCCHNR2011 TaxID=3057376 RepID=UPI0028EDFA97|nr:hypothetical protein [Bradyrhizobium sp. SZCCHNR2011]
MAVNAAARTAIRPKYAVIVVILGWSWLIAIGCLDDRTGSKRSNVIDITHDRSRAPLLRGCRKAIGAWPVCEQQIGQMRFYRISLAGKKSQTVGSEAGNKRLKSRNANGKA